MAHAYGAGTFDTKGTELRYVADLIAATGVTASGQAFVEWWSEFDADGADEPGLARTFADDVYAGGIAGLAERFSQ